MIFLFFPSFASSQKKEDFYGPAYVQNFGEYTQGQSVHEYEIMIRLFIDKKCNIPIAGSGSMRSSLVGPWTGIKREGCWYRTISDGYVIIYRDGTSNSFGSFNTLLRVDLLDDGSGIVKQKTFNYKTEMQKESEKRIKDYKKRFEEGIM